MTHPLTDETCEQIAPWSVQAPCGYTNMRAAYDKGFDDAIECIRQAGIASFDGLYEAQESFYKQQEES